MSQQVKNEKHFKLQDCRYMHVCTQSYQDVKCIPLCFLLKMITVAQRK